jgi:hypothetical protein
MATWQIILIIVGCMVGGIGLSLTTISVIRQLKKGYHPRRHPINPTLVLNQNALKYIEQQPPPIFIIKDERPFTVPAGREVIPRPTTAKPISEDNFERTGRPPTPEPAPTIKSDIFRELESNLIIATSPLSHTLQPFLTSVWDKHELIADSILKEHYEKLAKVYSDIELANMIVVLAQRSAQRTVHFDHSYLRLCGRIAENISNLIKL